MTPNKHTLKSGCIKHQITYTCGHQKIRLLPHVWECFSGASNLHATMYVTVWKNFIALKNVECDGNDRCMRDSDI